MSVSVRKGYLSIAVYNIKRGIEQMKVNIREALYQYNEDYDLFRNSTKYKLKDLFANHDIIDFIIDIRDIVHIEMEYMRYHHNRLWCYFGTPTSEEERVDMRMRGEHVELHKTIWPMFRVNVNVFRKALQYEIDNIPYEVFLSLKTKYVHVKLRRTDDRKS